MLIFLLLVFAPALLFLVGVYLWSNNKKSNLKIKRYHTSPKKANTKNPEKANTKLEYKLTETFINREPPPLESISFDVHPKKKLLAMVENDEATAQHLIEHEKKLNPGYFENWYIEKAINRLEHDRNV